MIYMFALTFLGGFLLGYFLGYEDDDGAIYVDPSSVRLAVERQERERGEFSGGRTPQQSSD